MVQRRAARFVFNDYFRASHVSPMIDHLSWDNLQQRRLLHQATMFYKIHQGLVGINLPDVLWLEHPGLPNICPYRQIQSCVNVYKFSFYPRTIVTWNQIPLNLTIFSNQPQVSEHLPYLQLSHLMSLNSIVLNSLYYAICSFCSLSVVVVVILVVVFAVVVVNST
jgi:hypothetical protein